MLIWKNARKSSDRCYGTVAVTIHWLSAVLIIALIVSGFSATTTEDLTIKADILRVHLPLGVLILLLTLARIFWWLWVDKKPASVAMPRLQNLIARATHMIFYILILGVAASGIAMILLSGAGAIIFGFSPEALPNFLNYPPRAPHGIGARLMIVLFVLHAGAALYHHFVKRDGLLYRMWYQKK